MNQALQQFDPTGLLPRIAAPHLVAFVLVLSRVGPLFVLAPIFSSKMIPARAKLMAALAIAFALTPIAEHGQRLPEDVLGIGGLVMKEALVGVAFAFVLAGVAAAIQAGAALLDSIIGFSFASIVDPITNMQNAVLGQIYSVFTVVIFVVTGGDQMMIMGLARSYTLVTLTQGPDTARLGAMGLSALTSVFVIGLEVAAPAIVALIVADAAFAIVARAVPQMNVFVVGLPAKIMLGFATVAVSLPFVATHVQDDLANAVMSALQGISGK